MKKLLHYGPGLVIGIPTLGRPVPLDWALAFKSLHPPINYNTTFSIIRNNEVGVARNDMAVIAIESGAKYLFFVGDDVEIPNHALRSMIYRMEQRSDIGVIGGVYCAKADPAYPLVFKGNGKGAYWDWKIGEFFEVTGLGMDCTLIRVDLLEKLYATDKVMFKTVKDDKFLDGVNSAEEWTEDLFFLRRVAEETDYKIFCDGGVICRHWDVYGNRPYELPHDSLPMRQLVVDGDLPKLLDIDGLLKDFKGYNRVTFGESEDMDYRGIAQALPFDEAMFNAVNLPATQITDIGKISDIVKESVRVLKSSGIIKITHSDGINANWLVRILESLGIIDLKVQNNLIEGTKT